MIDLRTARFFRGWTQQDLKNLSGVHQSRISNFEKGHCEPNEMEKYRLAKTLGINEDEIIWRHGRNQSINT